MSYGTEIGTVLYEGSREEKKATVRSFFFHFYSFFGPLDTGQGASCRQEAGCGASEIFRMGLH